MAEFWIATKQMSRCI